MTRRSIISCLPVLGCLFCPPAAAQDRDNAVFFCEDTEKPFFAPSSAAAGEFSPQRSRALPSRFLMPKPAGVKRVFVVGESAANILGPANARQAGFFNANGGLEVINCGMGGYESYRISGVLEEVLRYSPDLVVVLSGNNEGQPEPCPGLRPELRRRKARLLERIYALTRDEAQAERDAAGKIHGDRLAAMARAARRAGVPAVFCTLPLNIKDLPPRRGLPLENRDFAAGYRLFYGGDADGALRRFLAASTTGAGDPFFSFYAGQALAEKGRGTEAREFFLKTLDEDGDPARSARLRNAGIRRAAAAGGACVADLEKLFDGLAPDGTPGFDEFSDGMHWRPFYNKAVWDEIFRGAAACGAAGFGSASSGRSSQWAQTPRQDAVVRLSYAFAWLEEGGFSQRSLAQLTYIRGKVPGLLAEAGAGPERLERLIISNVWAWYEKGVQARKLYPLFLAHLAETERRAGEFRAALELCGRALALKPDDAYIKLEKAQVLAGLGRRGEAARIFVSLRETSAAKAAASLAAAWGFDPPAAGTLPGPAGHSVAELPSEAQQLASEKARRGSRVPALMNACRRLSAADREQALRACQEIEAAYAMGGGGLEVGASLACDASFEAYKLLTALGRREEALASLAATVQNAPPGWTGLAAAKKILERRQPVR